MNVDDSLRMLARDAGCPVDLAELALQLAQDEYPTLDVAEYLDRLDHLAGEARSFLGKNFEAKVAGLCRFLFREVGFHGNQKEYYDPRNSYLNEVLDRQTGIPITLSLVTMEVGRRLGLRITGIALPGHFVVMARGQNQDILLDPFNDGERIEPNECDQLVQRATGMNLEVKKSDLSPALPGAIVVRMLMNLKGCYLRAGEYTKAARVIGRLIQAAPNDWIQQRDLGACYLQAGLAGKAIDPLEDYLQHTPDAIDREAVQKLIRKARKEVAKWN